MSVLSAERVRRLSLGVSVLDDVFPGFEPGDFVVLRGFAARYLSFVLCVRCQLSHKRGGLRSSAVFVDGGNSFNPYLVAEVARDLSVDSRVALERIYVSRAFTAYQLCYLVLERLERFLNRKRAKLLVVSDIASLFFDRDIPKGEARDLFMKVCEKLSEIAAKWKTIVVVTYAPRRSRRGLFFEAVLFGRANVLIGLRKVGKLLRFVLDRHPRVKPFSMDFPLGYTPLTAFMDGGVKVGENCSVV